MSKKISLALIFGLLLALAVALPATAQEPEPTPSADEVNAIAKNMFCPVCENTPLDVCGTAACAQWRQQIADLLVEGYSEEEIYDYFVQQYGDRVLAEPPRHGLNWLIYIAPPVMILIGVVYLIQYMRKNRTDITDLAADEDAATGEADDEYRSQIEEELKKRL
jgi:cytochrome c-type biogenesis protein CcmH